MNEMNNCTVTETPALKEQTLNVLSKLSGEEILKLGGMICLTGTICACIFCAAGYEVHYHEGQLDIKKSWKPQAA